MIRRFWNCFLAVSLISLGGCRGARNDRSGVVAEARNSGPESVVFDILPEQPRDGSQAWLASYVSKGRTARFKIELGPATASTDNDTKGFSVKFGKGRLVAQPQSDASALLADLKNALAAKVLPSKIERSVTLPFTFVNFGEMMSHSADGGFNANPRGSWTAMKIFLETGGRECEVFLNLSPETKKGEFSIKDEEYGDLVVAQLAEVL